MGKTYIHSDSLNPVMVLDYLYSPVNGSLIKINDREYKNYKIIDKIIHSFETDFIHRDIYLED